MLVGQIQDLEPAEAPGPERRFNVFLVTEHRQRAGRAEEVLPLVEHPRLLQVVPEDPARPPEPRLPRDPVSSFIIWPLGPSSPKPASSFQLYLSWANVTQLGNQRLDLGFSFQLYYARTDVDHSTSLT